MSLTPKTSDSVTGAGRSTEAAPRGREEALERLTPGAGTVAHPLPLISAHQVLLGTAAATADAPTFDDEPEADAAVPSPAVLRSGWMGAVARRIWGPHERRPYYPARSESEFMADARMSREMHRL